MEFRILGPLEALEGDRPVPLGGRKQRALLAVLLLHPNEVVSRDRLIDDLWGERAPKSASEIVRVFVSRLRKTLEPGTAGDGVYRVLQTRPPGYLLEVEPDRLDAQRFERGLALARRASEDRDSETAATILRAALALWRGPPLADFTYEPFAQSEIMRLEELRLAAVEDRIEADLARACHGELVAELEALVREHPRRERLRAQLMLALYGSGRQAEALEAYRRERATLAEELGIEPGRALRDLEAAILRQDSTLSPPTPAWTATLAPAEKRKVVTVLAVLLAATGPGGDQLDPEAQRPLRRRWLDAVDRATGRHGGTAQELAGDTTLAVFGVPSLHEDDALRALRAASELREALSPLGEEARELDVRLEAGMGVASGEVVVGGAVERTLVTGDVVIAAGRLAELARPGELILDEATRQLAGETVRVELLAPLTLKGRRAALTPWRLVEVASSPSPPARELEASMVGRERQLEQLQGALVRVREERSAELVTVIGEPGIGKSRLACELAAAVGDDVRVVVGHCLPYGDGITFWPLREIVTAVAGGMSLERLRNVLAGEEDAEAVAAAVRGALGVAGARANGGETFWAFRRLFEALGRGTPLVAVFEDIHWAEPTFLDLVEHLADSLREAPVLLVCVGRPELLENRPGWDAVSRATIELEPLPEAATEALVAALAGKFVLDRATAARVVARAGGNPLFVEQILAMLADEGRLDVERSLPPTVQALLAARLERLGPAERAVVDRAAVVGREFSEALVVDLLPASARPDAVRRVDALVRKQVLRRTARMAGEDRVGFRHVLIQDVAYRTIPKELRADLHEQVGARLQRAARSSATDEIIGYHLEHAYRYRVELSAVGDHERELARQATRHLGASGRRALLTGDAPAAVNLLSRATSLAPPDDPDLVLTLDLAEALTQVAELTRAEEVLSEAIRKARAAGDSAAELRFTVARAPLLGRLNGAVAAEDQRSTVRAAISELERLDDDAGLVKAWRALGELEPTRGRARSAFERALRHADLIGDEREQAELRIAIGKTFIFDATPADDAIRHIELNLRWARSKGFRKAVGECLGGLAHLHAMGGRFTRARSLATEQKAIFEDLGQRFMTARFAFASGSVEMLAGDPAAAEREWCAGHELLFKMGDRTQSLGHAFSIARAVYAQGRYEDAERWADIADNRPAQNAALTARDPRSRMLRARLLARSGDPGRAEQLARAAVEEQKRSDEIDELADMVLDLAEVLSLAGRPAEAVPVVKDAIHLYERKGNVVSAGRSRALIERLQSPRAGSARATPAPGR